MERQTVIADLEVVGYADVLTHDALPTAVSPIYRFRERPTEILLPPFDEQGGVLEGGSVATWSEFEQALRDEEVSRLETPLPALPGYLLWVRLDRSINYSPIDKVRDNLDEISRQYIAKSWLSFFQHDKVAALSQAQTAFCADDRCFHAVLIKAAIYHHRGEHEIVGYLAGLAEELAPGEDFFGLVSQLARNLGPVLPPVDAVPAVATSCAAPRSLKKSPDRTEAKFSNLAAIH